jgi:hypothetical protein
MTYSLEQGLDKTGLPLIAVNILNQNICFMLDTGAKYNFIDERLHAVFEDTEEIEIFYEEEKTKVNTPFTFEGQKYNEVFYPSEIVQSVCETIHRETGMKLHGALGSNFLLKHEWVIDFKNRQLCNQ